MGTAARVNAGGSGATSTLTTSAAAAKDAFTATTETAEAAGCESQAYPDQQKHYLHAYIRPGGASRPPTTSPSTPTAPTRCCTRSGWSPMN